MLAGVVGVRLPEGEAEGEDEGKKRELGLMVTNHGL